VVITKTGVKHLHHAAMQFDIGIYFEANGHGTVLFSNNYWDFTKQLPRLEQEPSNTSTSTTTDTASSASLFFSRLPHLIHPAVGDALSDLLLVDVLLQGLHWTLHDWATKLYVDLPSRQLKVNVADRSVVTCNANETICLTPHHLQGLLDHAVHPLAPHGRAFVRASGTEHVVRVYAEAATRDHADTLATQVAQLVHDHCGGVGPLPKI
jgi:phosphoacetylglucosamine mutase